MINGENLFNQTLKNGIRTYDNILKLTTFQGHYYTTSCLLDYPYFKEYYKILDIDFRKQQALDSDPKAI